MPLDRMDIEDVDDMPPLVDNPNASLTYTFLSEMTPLSFTSTPAPTAAQDISPQPPSSLISSPPASPITSDDPTPGISMPISHPRPHGKRRDPSYIPRPPNAFILFRSAFIREQNVPGKVEGNHSLCWKQLPPEEREKWEAQAVIAQAEHRAQYPDWRFRPGANAMVKLKVSNVGGAAPPTRRRSARSRTKDPPIEEEGEDEGDVDMAGADPKGRGKGKGKAKSSRLLSLEETRYAKIAGFVAEGIKGKELEVAVKQWEGDRRMPRASATSTRPAKSRGTKSQGSTSTKSHARSQSDVALPTQSSSSSSFASSSKQPPSGSSSNESTTPTHTQSSLTPVPTLDISSRISKPGASSENHNLNTNSKNSNNPVVSIPDLSLSSDVPLTHLFKRSFSAPVSNKRLSSYSSSDAHPHPHPSSELSPSDESSAEEFEFSPTSAEPSPGTWGTLGPLLLPHHQQEAAPAPTRTHTYPQGHAHEVGRDTNSIATFSMPSPQHQHLTWEEAENQRRLEEMQSPDSWWTERSPAVESHFVFEDHDHCREDSDVGTTRTTFSTDNMGYEAPQAQGGSPYERGYMEQYTSFEPAQDGSQHVEWTDLSQSHSTSAGGNNSRQGLAVVIEDPYKDDCCNDDSPSSAASPPTLSLPPLPLSSSSYYYSSHSSVSPHTPPTLRSSSFSTLTGWAGDYKYQTSNVRTWPDNSNPPVAHSAPAPAPPPMSSTASSEGSVWYNSEGVLAWGSGSDRPQLQHPTLSSDVHDWDRIEYRAASDLHLPVSPPPRQLDFQDELRRLHSGR